jgi:hypothetical protein
MTTFFYARYFTLCLVSHARGHDPSPCILGDLFEYAIPTLRVFISIPHPPTTFVTNPLQTKRDIKYQRKENIVSSSVSHPQQSFQHCNCREKSIIINNNKKKGKKKKKKKRDGAFGIASDTRKIRKKR